MKTTVYHLMLIALIGGNYVQALQIKLHFPFPLEETKRIASWEPLKKLLETIAHTAQLTGEQQTRANFSLEQSIQQGSYDGYKQALQAGARYSKLCIAVHGFSVTYSSDFFDRMKNNKEPLPVHHIFSEQEEELLKAVWADIAERKAYLAQKAETEKLEAGEEECASK